MKIDIIIIGYIHVYMNIHASQFLEKNWTSLIAFYWIGYSKNSILGNESSRKIIK